MKQFYQFSVVLLFLLSFFNIHAQDCGFDSYHKEMMKNPVYKQAFLQNTNASNLRSGVNRGTVYTIPVVFHVVHLGEPYGVGSNITDEQLISCIDALNRDYRRNANDGGIAQSGPLGTDVEIEFCLAKLDENGDATDGINRIDGSNVPGYTQYGVRFDGDAATYPNAATSADMENLIQWDKSKYLNIWVVHDIPGGVAGFAGPGLGDIQEHRYTGNNPASNPNPSFTCSPGYMNRVMTHELGHYLGLAHPHDNNNPSACVDGDGIADTPPCAQLDAIGSTFKCTNGAACPTENMENYMTYYNDGCESDFTAGQVAVMRSTLLSTHSGIANDIIDRCESPYTYNATIRDVFNIANPFCEDTLKNVIVKVLNGGQMNLTSFNLYYSLDGAPLQSIPWTGNLTKYTFTNITLPNFPNITPGSHTLTLLIDTANLNGSQLDEAKTDNSYVFNFDRLTVTLPTLTPSISEACPEQVITFTASSGVDYNWYDGGSGATKIDSTEVDSTFWVEVEYPNGCKVKAYTSIHIRNNITLNLTPDDDSVCVGSPLNINVTGADTYTWLHGASGSNISVTPYSNSNYTVYAVNNDKCKDTASVLIIAKPIPQASISPLNPLHCVGTPITLTSNNGSSFQWNDGSTLSTATFTPNDTTEYWVAVTGSNGCVDTAYTTVKTKLLEPGINAGDTSLCMGDSTLIVASGGDVYQWSNGANGFSQMVKPISTTTYQVQVTDSIGCIAQKSIKIIVDPIPVVANVVPQNVNVCQGDAVSLSASGGPTFEWSTGESTSSISYSPIADTVITVIVSNNNGCQDIATVSIHTFNNISTNITGDAFLCKGEQTTLQASGGQNYVWATGQTTASITVAPVVSTIYKVVAKIGSCQGDTADVYVQVTEVPDVTALASPTSVFVGQNVFFDYVSINALTYLWDFGDGQTSNNPISLHSYSSNGLYQATLYAYNGDCMDSSFVSVYVGQDAGLSEHSFDYSIYPNPVTNTLYIQNTATKISKLEILNPNGMLMLTQDSQPSNLLKVEVDFLPTGVYLLKLLDENNKVTLSKMVKN